MVKSFQKFLRGRPCTHKGTVLQKGFALRGFAITPVTPVSTRRLPQRGLWWNGKAIF